MIYKTLLSKLTNPTKIRNELRCSGKMRSSLNHKECDIPHTRDTHLGLKEHDSLLTMGKVFKQILSSLCPTSHQIYSMKQSPCCFRDIFKIEKLKKKKKIYLKIRRKKPKNNIKHYTKNTLYLIIKEEA